MVKSETKPVDLVIRAKVIYTNTNVTIFAFSLCPRYSRRTNLMSLWKYESRKAAMTAGRRWAKRHGVTIANE